MTYLPDVNVWIDWPRNDTSIITQPGIGSAIFKMKGSHSAALLNWVLRLLTNKHVMQEEILRPDEAWQAYRVLRLDRRIGYLAEPNEFPETWQAFTVGPLSSPNLWTDAYLCAFAHAARLTIVTFDARSQQGRR